MGMKIREVMAKNVATVPPTMPLKEVARLLTTWRISGVPVVDEGGRLHGVVCESDILEKERRPDRSWRRTRMLLSRRYRQAEAKRKALTAGEAMTSPAVTISPFASVAEAATTMVERGVDRLVVAEQPFMDRDGEDLVGTVTRGDLVRVFARSDGEIEREIRTLFEHDFGLLPGEARAQVQQGEVKLEGTVDLRRTAEDVEAMVGLVPGVVALESKLASRMDDLPSPGSMI